MIWKDLFEESNLLVSPRLRLTLDRVFDDLI
ncbi:hypothetical protein ACVWW4_000353 [Bradyrhizobium sp. LB7.1]